MYLKKSILYSIENKILQELEDIDTINGLYYGEYILPIDEHINNHINKKLDDSDTITKLINQIGKDHIINKIRYKISTIEELIPLYDINTENLYIISKTNVYKRVVETNYRFVDNILKNKFIKIKDYLEQEKLDEISKDPIKLRKLRKLKLLIGFLETYIEDELFNTYIKVFYKYSSALGKNITTCERPSFTNFFEHLQPYYSRSQLINMGLNMGIITPDKTYYDDAEVKDLCTSISPFDISASILLNHQKHIVDQDKVGLVQYYSLQGSYFMNQYLRDLSPYPYKNILLEDIIQHMWHLVKKSPSFNKSYIVYRFIENDSHIRDLAIGDNYTEPSFISTTRDPFYKSDVYKFGFILIKIRIPADIKGVALCMETFSHFKAEQEIIFPPLTQLKLEKKDSKCLYYHTDEKYSSQVKYRYEFSYVGNQPISFINKPILNKEILVDFLKIPTSNSLSLDEKIKQFIMNYVNSLFQFKTKIGENDEIFTINIEWYNSTSAYKDFYAIKTSNGFSMYTFYKNYMLFSLEIGEDDEGSIMHVNFHSTYTIVNIHGIINDSDFIYFISTIAYHFDIYLIILYTDYMSCNTKQNSNKKTSLKNIVSSNPPNIKSEFIKNIGTHQRDFNRHSIRKGGAIISNKKSININNRFFIPKLPTTQNRVRTVSSDLPKSFISDDYLGGSYPIDFYDYLKNNRKRFYKNFSYGEVKPKFTFFQLDKIKKISCTQILIKNDRDEIYQIFFKVYLKKKFPDNIASFYIWLVDNYCYLIKTFITKLDRIYFNNNPFKQDSYIVDPFVYLYNRNYIPTLPQYNINVNRNVMRSTRQMNEYRLDISKRRSTLRIIDN
jgi:hypothetical protein